MLEGKRLLITGVLTEDSIAFAVAEGAQRDGAEVVLTGFGRGMRITERIARRLPTEPRRARARRQRARSTSRPLASRARRALGRARRRPARDRLRARGRARRPLPDDAARVGRARLPHERLLPQGPRRRAAPAAGEAREPAARSSASTSTPRWRGRSTTGWASPRRRWSRSTATSPATSAPAACAATSSPPGRSRRSPRSGIDGFEQLADAWERQAPLGWDTRDAGPGRRRVPLPALRPGSGGHRRDRPRRRRLPRAGRAAVAPRASALGRARVDRAPPQLGEHADRLVGVAAPAHAPPCVRWRSTIAHSACAQMRGRDVVGRDAALLVAPDPRLRGGDDAPDVGLPLGRQAVLAAGEVRRQQQDRRLLG